MKRALLSLFLAVPVLAADRPNVLLIIGDDQAWSDFGCMGHGVIETPHLDALAQSGAHFPRGYVPASLCRPSLMTMATGLYPHEHGVTGNDPPRGVDRERMLTHLRGLDPLPARLARAGYKSLQTGKWWEGHYSEGGFTHGMTTTGRHGGPGLKIGREGLAPIEEFLDGVGEDPWLIWYAPFLPHTPHNPPKELLEKYQGEGIPDAVARYRAMCEWFDQTVGELDALLAERDLTEDTLVIFLGDNGWLVDEETGGYAPRSKRTPYEGGVRTPVVVRWPGKVTPGLRPDLVSSIDLVPTVLAACGLPADPGLEGVNLLEVAAGQARARAGVYGCVFEHDVVDLFAPARGLVARWTIQDRWKLIRFQDPASEIELYDLFSDPWEEHNLARDNLAVVGRLQDRLDRWWTPHAPERPSFLIVVSDDQRFDQMGNAGHPVLQTPSMDRLASEGVRFDQAFVTTAICAASRATILTGRHERSHGYTFGRPAMPQRMARETYPAMLRAAGYRTGFCGKWGVKLDAREELFEWIEDRSPPYHKQDGRHATEILGDDAVKFLESCAPGEPFCLSVSFNAPHAEDSNPEQFLWPASLDGLYDDQPVAPAPLSHAAYFDALPQFQRESLNRVRWGWRFDSEEKRERMTRGYWRMITGVDQALGRMLDTLDERGLADDTIVIFTSDNGYFLGERGYAGKWLIHDESIHVPLIIRDPAVAGGRSVDALALNLDLAPTVLDLAGVARPRAYQGASLAPWLDGAADGWRTDFLHEHRFDHKQIPQSIGVRGERFVYVRYDTQEPEVEQLFDRWNDPLEAHDLAGDGTFARVLERMRVRCDELASEASGD